ncbi:MAG: ribosome recycling factor [Candidatus Buchananbacteria bacterium]
MSIIENHLGDFSSAIDHFRQDISTLKTGRANPGILDNVRVEAYESMTPLNQTASITVPDARCILIQPWDKSILKNIEKAINESGLGLNPVNEGDKIRITIPQMTEESRKDIVKILNQKAEQAKIAVRLVRDKVKEEILEAEKNKEFGEDEKHSLLENLDKKTSEFNEEIKGIVEVKEQEIMTI